MKNEKQYKELNGTFYDVRTNDEVVKILEHCRKNRIRIILDYGDVKTGKSWNEMYDICGYVGRSTGRVKIPILIYNERCFGGGAILDHCIIGIKTSKGKNILYSLNKI